MSAGMMQLTIPVSPKVYSALRERADRHELKPWQYAQRLFDAAWLARVTAERGEEQPDAELDAQVKQVFLLADCDAGDVAAQLGIPEARVARILEGWRQSAAQIAAGEIIAPPAARQEASQAPTKGEEGYRDPRSEKAWPAASIETARRMWAEGKAGSAIAAALGKTTGSVSVFITKNRALFPYRAAPAGGRSPQPGVPASDECNEELKGGAENP
jgi:hypothetical protein